LVANPLTYYDTATFTALKSFIVQAPAPISLQQFLHTSFSFCKGAIGTD